MKQLRKESSIRLRFSSFNNSTIPFDCDKIVSSIKGLTDLCIHIDDDLVIDDIDKLINEIIGKLQYLGYGLYKSHKEQILYGKVKNNAKEKNTSKSENSKNENPDLTIAEITYYLYK